MKDRNITEQMPDALKMFREGGMVVSPVKSEVVLTNEKLIDILIDVNKVEDRDLRLSIVRKLTDN